MVKGRSGIIVLIGIITIAFLIFAWIKNGYDRVVSLDENVKGAWAQVENQLKRRYDLIPNLVETVKGYAAHEKEIFEYIAQARTKYFQATTPKNKIEASKELEGAISRLLLLQERYPQLRANENFLKLQDSLEGTENRISVERKRYNDAVRELNTYIRTFFGRFFAALANVSRAEYYEIPEVEKRAPAVKF